MLQGIKHLSTKKQGYIYWKDQEVEHYDDPFDPNQKDNLLELERRCKLLEFRGKDISSASVIWKWDESGKGDPREIAFYGCEASEEAQNALWRICNSFPGLKGVITAAYIANIIHTETNKK